MSRRRWPSLLAKVAVSTILVVVLLTRLSVEDIRSAFVAPRWQLLGAALLIYGVSAVAGAQQWIWILRVAGLRTPTWQLHRLYLIGLFFNNFLPANVGGDAVKIYDLGRREGQPLKVFCATLLDRLLGLTSLTMLALLAVATAAARTLQLPPVYPLFVAMVIWLAVLTLLLSGRVANRVPDLLRLLRLRRLAATSEDVVSEFRLYRARAGWCAGIFGFAMMVQTLRVMTHVIVALGLNVPLTLEQGLQLFVLVPLLGILIALPVSVNGLGLRESASALTFTYAGISPENAVAIELTAYLVQILFSLLGGWWFWRGRRAGTDRLAPPS